MRIIDADPISKHLSIVIKHNIDKDLSYTKERLFKLMIDNAPTIEIEPAKHGLWVGIDDYPHESWECNVCGCVVEGEDDMSRFRYCPNCGAKMDLDEVSE